MNKLDFKTFVTIMSPVLHEQTPSLGAVVLDLLAAFLQRLHEDIQVFV